MERYLELAETRRAVVGPLSGNSGQPVLTFLLWNAPLSSNFPNPAKPPPHRLHLPQWENGFFALCHRPSWVGAPAWRVPGSYSGTIKNPDATARRCYFRRGIG